MKLTDTEKAFAYLRCVEFDIRKFLVDGDAVHATEYFEDVHAALVEALDLLGVEFDPVGGSVDEFAGLIAEYDKRMDAISLEDFDPLEKKHD